MFNGVAFPDPGVHKSMNCRVCGAPMQVERDRVGPTSYVAWLAGAFRRHDRFICSDRDEAWHRRAAELRDAASRQPSDVIRRVLEHEASQLCGEGQEPRR